MSPTPQNSIPTAQILGDLARQAGAITLNYFRKSFSLTEKSGDQGIVTEADFASEKFIKFFIQNHYPHHTILAEESGLTSAKNEAEAQPIWIIDPIDGTTNFSNGNPYYCISIGFGFKSTDGRCQMHAGAIYQPATDLLYTAERGMGSFCNGEAMRVSDFRELRASSVCTGFASAKNNKVQAVLARIEKIQNNCLGIRINGAAALDLCHVAKGMFQAFVEDHLSPWDLAAGSLIVSEAGGQVLNLKGEEFDTLRDSGIICGNRAIIAELYTILFKK